jgi:hypothetical protein
MSLTPLAHLLWMLVEPTLHERAVQSAIGRSGC